MTRRTPVITPEWTLELLVETFFPQVVDENSKSTIGFIKKLIDNSEVVPVDTVAPETPKDSAEVNTPVLPQAGAEDSTEQATPTETTAESVGTTQSEQPAEVQETPQENTQQESTESEQATVSE